MSLQLFQYSFVFSFIPLLFGLNNILDYERGRKREREKRMVFWNIKKFKMANRLTIINYYYYYYYYYYSKEFFSYYILFTIALLRGSEWNKPNLLRPHIIISFEIVKSCEKKNQLSNLLFFYKRKKVKVDI